MRNISNYSNLLEQQLFMDKVNPCNNIDTTPCSAILMTNLSSQDNGISKNNFEQAKSGSNKENGDSKKMTSQKSMLGGKVLKFKNQN